MKTFTKDPTTQQMVEVYSNNQVVDTPAMLKTWVLKPKADVVLTTGEWNLIPITCDSDPSVNYDDGFVSPRDGVYNITVKAGLLNWNAPSIVVGVYKGVQKKSTVTSNLLALIGNSENLWLVCTSGEISFDDPSNKMFIYVYCETALTVKADTTIITITELTTNPVAFVNGASLVSGSAKGEIKIDPVTKVGSVISLPKVVEYHNSSGATGTWQTNLTSGSTIVSVNYVKTTASGQATVNVLFNTSRAYGVRILNFYSTATSSSNYVSTTGATTLQIKADLGYGTTPYQCQMRIIDFDSGKLYLATIDAVGSSTVDWAIISIEQIL
jgi:hypothetical protein